MTPPLALYVHLPWCVQKCPYCDFNSHALRGALPEAAYRDALLADLALERAAMADDGRAITSIFFGGGYAQPVLSRGHWHLTGSRRSCLRAGG